MCHHDERSGGFKGGARAPTSFQGQTETRRVVKPEFKQQLRRRLRKCHLKSEFALPQTFNELIPSRLIPQMLENFSVQLNSEGLYQSSRKQKESCCLVFPSSTKREIRHFHVVAVQRRLRNVQKGVSTCKVVVLPISSNSLR